MTVGTIAKVWCFCSSMKWNSLGSVLPSGPVLREQYRKCLCNSTLQKPDMAFEAIVGLYLNHITQEKKQPKKH